MMMETGRGQNWPRPGKCHAWVRRCGMFDLKMEWGPHQQTCQLLNSEVRRDVSEMVPHHRPFGYSHLLCFCSSDVICGRIRVVIKVYCASPEVAGQK